jgi:hypothetical protein
MGITATPAPALTPTLVVIEFTLSASYNPISTAPTTFSLITLSLPLISMTKSSYFQ